MRRLAAILPIILAWASASAQTPPGGYMLSGPTAGAPPSTSTGGEGNYFYDLSRGSIYGPKAFGQWPPTPIYPGIAGNTTSITAYGAKCDGTTVDDTAFATMVAAVNAAAQPITITFPGACVVTPTPYTFTTNVSFLGINGGGLKLAPNSSPTTSFLTWATAGNISIQSFTLDFNSATAVSTNRWAGLAFGIGQCPTVSDSQFVHGGTVTGSSAAIYMIDGTGLTCGHFMNNYFAFNAGQNTNNQGVLTYGPDKSDDLVYTDNTFVNTGFVNFAAQDKFSAKGNIISGWGFGAAIEFGSITTSDATIKHGVIADNVISTSAAVEDVNATALPGIESGYNGIQITGNRIDHTCGEGIDLYGQANVTGNFIVDAGVCNDPTTYYNVGIGARTTSLTQDPSGSYIAGNSVTEDGGGHTAYGYMDSAAVTGVNLGPNAFQALSGAYNVVGTATYLAPTTDNRIVNPCFQIDQRNYGASVSTNAAFFADQWKFLSSHPTYLHMNSRLVVANMVQCPTSSKATVDIQTTPAANDFLGFYQDIAASDLSDFAYGESTAKYSTLAWCVVSSLTPPYTLSYSIQNLNATYSYVGNYTVTVGAAQRQCFSATIPPDSHPFGTLGSSAVAASVTFDLGSGANRKTSTVGSWVSGNFYGSTTASNFVANTAASVLEISNVRWFPNALDNGWIAPTYNKDIANAQRFFRSSFPDGTAPAQNAGVAGASCANGANPSIALTFSPPMMKAGTVTTFNPSAANANWRDTTAGSDLTVVVPTGGAAGTASTTSAFIGSSSAATGTDTSCIHYTIDGGL